MFGVVWICLGWIVGIYYGLDSWDIEFYDG